ncbi:Cd(II), Zn(II) and Co(II) exporter (ATPase) [Petrocella atlantisensis]|uniref:Cd(2+)-exporting ATPase n=1 Tax=Petrocella atlantisensis TaxID=2173034 RepID=A0A3P7S823_9FIRM|nr:heavy metal translocating P-type ATPase [Petrocella atlantisensis]VDN48229.1 Cd(II), Zn(II) and Co(II) exporter (ATPase) [Petrocella atlantisensis]
MSHEYILEGLNCHSCAMKIEDEVCKLSGIHQAHLNFATQTITIETLAQDLDLLPILQKKVNQIENGITVMKKKDQITMGLNQEAETWKGKSIWIRLIIGSMFFITGLILEQSLMVELIIYLVAYLTIGGDVLILAGRNIIKGKVFDENFLMSVATIGAFAIAEFPEAVTVMLFYQIGERFQDMAVHRSRKSIASLMDIRPDVAWVMNETELIQVMADTLQVNDRIWVKAGERIPLDGILVKGSAMLDTSALTGESVPRKVREGDTVLSGSVNTNGLIEVDVTKVFGESTVSKILNLVENATSKKAETEKFITTFAKYYTPIVVYLALALAFLPPLLMPGEDFRTWIHRALIFLVVSCPCALVISIPLGFFGGVGGASKHGILIKGSNYLEALNQVKTVVFDKTGTLTKGVFKVTKIYPVNTTEDEILKLGAYAEYYSNHPIGKSVIEAYSGAIDSEKIDDYEEIAGKGISITLSGDKVLAGNRQLMADYGIEPESADHLGTLVHVARDGIYMGYMVISDEIKSDSKKTISELRAKGITRIVMLTGDLSAVADQIAASLGIDEVYAGLLPHEKVEVFENIIKEQKKGKTLFVGDGINDAPVLARADIGVAMGGIGSDAAIEAADVVLMTDEPYKLVDGIVIAKRTKAIVWQNIGFAMGVKLIVLVLGAGGLATMWEAVFADVGVALIAIINAMRIIKNPTGLLGKK